MSICLLLNNIRSVHNVGSLIRTSDGFGVERLICSGYTPYPQIEDDPRLPHIRRKLAASIHKTALGAEEFLPISYVDQAADVIRQYKAKGYQVIGLEQAATSVRLDEFRPEGNILLLLGEEVDGLSQDLLQSCDVILEIPMKGQKESFNVSIAGGIALYSLSR